MHIRIPLSKDREQAFFRAKQGHILYPDDMDYDDGPIDWDEFDKKVSELYNPFEDIFSLVLAREGSLPFYRCPLRVHFVSCDDYLIQAKQYRDIHHLKPIEALTRDDMKEYMESKRNEKVMILKNLLGDDIK